MSLVFFHLFVVGCRFTSLVIHGGFLAILFPPLWIRITRKFQKSEGIQLLKRYHLEKHPGLLANLALIQMNRSEVQQARETLKLALDILPDHPTLNALFNATCRVLESNIEAKKPKSGSQ